MLTLCFTFMRGKILSSCTHEEGTRHYVLRHSSTHMLHFAPIPLSIDTFNTGEIQWFKATREVKNLLNKKKNSLPFSNVTHTHVGNILSILRFHWMENYKNWIQWNFFLSKWRRKEALMIGSYFYENWISFRKHTKKIWYFIKRCFSIKDTIYT